MFSNEQRFVWDIDSLREILKYPDQRNLLAASVVLRRLLTDSTDAGGTLLHKVARGRDFKPQFVVTGRAGTGVELPTENLFFQWRNPAAGQMDGLPTRRLSLDDFLREPVHRVRHTIITVKELINYVANVGGGVHQGTPRDKDHAKEIHASVKEITINGNPYPLQSMAHIAKITTEALYPLYLRIRA